MSTRTLKTTLPSGTLYVSGTVNGVSTTWTNIDGNTWETVADRSPQDVYVVALTIIDQSGKATDTTFTMYYGLHLVTDRTLSDVLEGNEKGTYNASDLNRVGAAVSYLAEILVSLPDDLKSYAESNGVAWDVFFDVPYDPPAYVLTVKTDWVEEDIPTPEQMELYLENAKALRNALDYDTDKLPDVMDNLSWQGANAIEKALEGLDEAITILRDTTKTYLYNTASAWFYSGDLFSGEV